MMPGPVTGAGGGIERGVLGSTIAKRYSTLASPNRTVARFALQATARELLSGERVAECMRSIVPTKAHVRIMHSPSVMKAHFKNLLICASVWHCPVCAAKISERRRIELTEAIGAHPELMPVLWTFTVQHTRADSLENTKRAVLSAYKRQTQGRGWQEIKARYGIVGTVRALEVTHTPNGWHVHIHTLAFFDRDADVPEVTHELSERWKNMLRKEGRFASDAHGVNVEFRKKAVAEYITKMGDQSWGLEHELTKSVVKVSKDEKGMTPFALLADYMNGNKHSGRLFVEYAHALKGARQLCWSGGLRERLGISKEKSDEEIAQEIETDAILLALLNRGQWKRVLGNDIRGELLTVAHAGDAAALWRFLGQFGIEQQSEQRG